jgi:hypothetical protein
MSRLARWRVEMDVKGRARHSGMKALSIIFAAATVFIVVLIVLRHGFRMQSDTVVVFDQDFAILQMLGVIVGLLSVGAAAAHLVKIRDRY